jgi:hypothetical protein
MPQCGGLKPDLRARKPVAICSCSKIVVYFQYLILKLRKFFTGKTGARLVAALNASDRGKMAVKQHFQVKKCVVGATVQYIRRPKPGFA